MVFLQEIIYLIPNICEFELAKRQRTSIFILLEELCLIYFYLCISDYQNGCYSYRDDRMISWQGSVSVDQFAQSPISPGIEHFQGWSIHHFSEQLVPMPHHPTVKTVFHISNLNFSSFCLNPLPLVLPLQFLMNNILLVIGKAPRVP